MKLGIRSNPRATVIQEIEWAAANGFNFVEILLEAPGAALETTDWEALTERSQALSIDLLVRAAEYLVVNSPSSSIRQAAMHDLKRTLDIAAGLNAAICTIPFLGWPDYLDEATGFDFCKQLYTILVSHAQSKGIQVALENSDLNAHQLKYFREIFHRVPGLSLTYNVARGNIQTAQIPTRDYLFALADRLVHVAISDNGGSANDRLPFGAPSGRAINLRRELQLLQDFSFDGTIALDIGGDRRWVVASAGLLRAAWQNE